MILFYTLYFVFNVGMFLCVSKKDPVEVLK
jgi:hypothetical protein